MKSCSASHAARPQQRKRSSGQRAASVAFMALSASPSSPAHGHRQGERQCAREFASCPRLVPPARPSRGVGVLMVCRRAFGSPARPIWRTSGTQTRGRLGLRFQCGVIADAGRFSIMCSIPGVAESLVWHVSATHGGSNSRAKLSLRFPSAGGAPAFDRRSRPLVSRGASLHVGCRGRGETAAPIRQGHRRAPAGRASEPAGPQVDKCGGPPQWVNKLMRTSVCSGKHLACAGFSRSSVKGVGYDRIWVDVGRHRSALGEQPADATFLAETRGCCSRVAHALPQLASSSLCSGE